MKHLPETPFLLFDDARHGSEAGGRCYSRPVDTIIAKDLADVAPAFDCMRAAYRRGRHLAGFVTYEAGYALDPRLVGLMPASTSTVPLLWFGIFDRKVELTRPQIEALLPSPCSIEGFAPVVPNISHAVHRRNMEAVMEYIHAGDIYQANLTFRSTVEIGPHPLAFFAAIRERASAGYGAVVSIPSHYILSFSPELFFRLADGCITSRPMKGTAPRGSTPRADEELAQALAKCDKQRAENLMIVDLLRNDLAQVSLPGSVKVPRLFDVERYPTLHQLVSEIRAVLKPSLNAIDILASAFPCGSITGAPKVRSMEIIAELENDSRGIYTGSIGWIDPAGEAEFNVAIRTISLERGATTGTLGLGSGIVADSKFDLEWDECLVKSKFLS
ncbi:aminodeoxychorismate synthase component I [Sphingobium lactosutens]|uniref:aminodeoxychorismate synthase component I n=1 Tax=Sphingobium lactosutens TaxID=522773 RepID=UPI0015BA7525|nr:aminodeoxychorismate synthase component I [Sphingobium lactosutens]NWK97507.1 aminodeoxychorismate synthase component I [Sphingobium lactosutens]